MSEFSLSLPLDQLADAVAERLEDRRRWAHTEGVAAYLGCDTGRVEDLRARGMPAIKLPGEKPGTLAKKNLYDLREVDAWIEREGVRV